MTFSVFSKINEQHMHSVELVLVDLVESLVFFLAGTDISITNCNTVYTTSCRLTTRGPE